MSIIFSLKTHFNVILIIISIGTGAIILTNIMNVLPAILNDSTIYNDMEQPVVESQKLNSGITYNKTELNYTKDLEKSNKEFDSLYNIDSINTNIDMNLEDI